MQEVGQCGQRAERRTVSPCAVLLHRLAPPSGPARSSILQSTLSARGFRRLPGIIVSMDSDTPRYHQILEEEPARMVTRCSAARVENNPRRLCCVDLGMPPAAPSFRAAPTEAATVVIPAPVPSGTMPAVRVPAMPATAPTEIDLLDRSEAIKRCVHTCCRHRCICAAGDR
jgi:hypothetical protein